MDNLKWCNNKHFIFSVNQSNILLQVNVSIALCKQENQVRNGKYRCMNIVDDEYNYLVNGESNTICTDLRDY